MKQATIIVFAGAMILLLAGCSLFQQESLQIENWQPTMSPDSTTIAYASPGEKGFELFMKDLETGQVTQLTQNEVDDWAPSWSPEADKIVFSSDREDNVDLYIIDLSTLAMTRITAHEGEDINPYWTANNKILFNSNRADKWGMYMIDPDGKNLTVLGETVSTE
jgi:dipeptidyl aminopeptidase/acylaminoacyl peptidase